jgi:hypothetical protein
MTLLSRSSLLRPVSVAALCSALAPCVATGAIPTKNKPYAFQVRITLSEKAAATLKRLNEGMVISGSYSGDPQPSANGKPTRLAGSGWASRTWRYRQAGDRRCLRPACKARPRRLDSRTNPAERECLFGAAQRDRPTS